MKYFLVLLFACVSFFASAQDSLVTIKPSTARYYLAVEDSFNIYKLRDTKHIQLIGDLLAKDEVREQQMKNCAKDVERKNEEAALDKEELVFYKNELRIAKSDIRKQKFQKVVIIIGGVVLVILVAI